MSNPYRARPTKPRVDHSAAYGMQNQNMWMPRPMMRPQSDIVLADTQQSSVMNQSKHTSNAWKDPWDWNLDQQSDIQHQQQQQSQQQQQQLQQHYLPSYQNQGRLLSNSVQDHYYTNLNGNMTNVLNQNSMSDRDNPRSESAHQIDQTYTDSLSLPYTNYKSQQYPLTSQHISNNTKPAYEHVQWPSEHQSIVHPAQQRLAPQGQKGQPPTYLPPVGSHNNYNWNKDNTVNLQALQNDWQNYDMLTRHTVQEQHTSKEIQQQVDVNNSQSTQLQQIYNAPTNVNDKEYSTNWINKKKVNETDNRSDISNQWHNENHESVISHPQMAHQVQTSNVDDTFNSWSQSGNTGVLHDWKHSNVQNDANQWIQQVDNNSCKENTSQDNINTRFTANEWQTNQHATSHTTISTTVTPASTTIENTVHILNNNEQQEIEKQTSTVAYDPTSHARLSDVKSSFENLGNSNAIADVSKNNISKNIPVENHDHILTPTTEELFNNFNHLNIGKKLNNDHSDESLEIHSNAMEGRAQYSSNFNNADIRGKPISDNTSVSSAVDHMGNSHSIDSQPIINQDRSIPNTCQSDASKITDVSQSGYDQWYNQNALSTSLENSWYVKDPARSPPKQWGAEQNVENYENIQQTSDFVNVEVIAPATALQERDIYGSRDSINKETLDNDPKSSASLKETNIRDFREEVNNVEVPSMQQQMQQRPHPPLQTEQMPDNYEFASNDRNTFLETGELTDSHQEHESTPPSQDDENDEVPNDIPFLREVPGQSSTVDPRRNDPTGQETHVQTGQRVTDPRRNDPSGQEQSMQIRNIPDRVERRDVLPGQERNVPLLPRSDSELERRNVPSGRERSLPPQQSRNDPSGEERYQLQSQMILEPSETREVLGRGNESEETVPQTDVDLRQIPGGASSNDVTQIDDRTTGGRVVTGSLPEIPLAMQDQTNSETRSKREEAVGASLESDSQGVSGSNRRNSYEDDEDTGSRNSREENRERRRESSPDRRRYEYDRKNVYYDRDREYDDDYYYDRRRIGDTDRQYNTRDEFERRDIPYRDDDRKHSRDDLDRHARDDIDRRVRGKEDLDERDSRRRPDDRRRDESRRRDRDARDYDPRYPRDPRERDYMDRERRRDDRRSRRYDDYDIRDQYRRDYYDDPYGRSSRPSSRSSYNDRDREYYMRARDYYAYNGGYNGYDYNTHYGNNYYAYLENLRRTNPAAYSEWYHKYYVNQHQQQIARGVSNYPEDRASVHSGRSSCDDRCFPIPSACFRSANKTLYIPDYFGYPGWAGNLRERSTACRNCNRITGDKRTLADMSLLEDSTITSTRLTPTKFSTSHAYGCFSIGSLIHVYPSYPADGERAKVDIFRVDNLLSHDPITRNLRLYPGPLINGITHKKTIIEYCENKIKKAVINEDMIDRASYILLYELMIMLIQQNGNVVGVDIAALLLRNKDAHPYDVGKLKSQDTGRRESQISQRSGATGGDGSTQDISTLSDKIETKQRKPIEQITDEFRDTLLYGRVQEALEYAMNEGLWGHALFLASKLDKRTYASVMTRFANSLPSHDPLQTLYQLHSGRIPAIVTCVADPRWDDWRPHLAMIISNTSTNPEVNRRSITTLGDTLFARGDVHAAHFCYILAQIDFGTYGTNGVKLVLIGANHNKPYSEFFTMEAVMLTEIYEYARNLSDPSFTLVDLQTYKFDLTEKMVDSGLIEKALLYIEQIATNIAKDPLKYKKSFIEAVYVLGDRIKYYDPIFKDAIEETATLTWLDKLAEIVGKHQDENIEDELYTSRIDSRMENQEIHEIKHQQQQTVSLPPTSQQWGITQSEYGDGPTSMMEVSTSEVQSDWQPLSLPTNIQDTYDPNAQYMRGMDESVQYQQPQQQDWNSNWNQQSCYQNNYGRNESTPGLTSQTEIDNSQSKDKWNYEAEREDKTPTPEVSNYGLISDNDLDLEGSPDAIGISALRRRNISAKSSIFNNNGPTFFDLSNSNLETKSQNSCKSFKYPKLIANYPKIVQNERIHSKNIKKSKLTNPAFSKPPCSQPPIFLKCKIKKKNPLEDKEETILNRPFCDSVTSSQTTDLDIQFSKLKLESFVAQSVTPQAKVNDVISNSEAQTLKQYCNFEEKKVMRVAPHIRRKDVICDTVDAWSYDNNTGQNVSELSRYKPLVFGGTYPIDLPLRFRNNNRITEDILIKKNVSLTYNIDVPTKCD